LRSIVEVTLGPGTLAGVGVYAARDFAPGEVVVAYELRPLDEAGYAALPAGERLFVHSYGGRRFLYPAPARFVNHADDPNCYQDFDRAGDVALRPIARGEPITIDATQETARELSTFLDAYRAGVSGLVSPGTKPVPVPTDLSDVEWFIGTGRWEALCSATTPHGHLTLLLKVIDGNWQIVYAHLG
jgi:hypothetical protein